MRVIKYLIFSFLILIGLVTLIYLADATMKTNSNQIIEIDSDNLNLINTADIYINMYYAKNSRLPDAQEVSLWMNKNNDHYEGRGYSYRKAPFHENLDTALGIPPKDAFILSYWDGDFTVDYASWFGNRKQAYIPDSEFFKWGSQLADCAILFIAIIVIIRMMVSLLKY